MPIYAYKCGSCGFAKDVLQKISDPLLTVCPTCGASTFTKQLTAAGFQLKGSGWYATDFKGGAATAPAKDNADAPAPESKTEQVSPVKTETAAVTPATTPPPASAAASSTPSAG
jgi:putative FmdB family regulatory protein